MKEISLFEHNEIGYEKTVVDLKDNKSTTINHATGTGKSFIALKLIYNFINNKILTNVRNNENIEKSKPRKVLYIAPTYQIIDQLFNSTHKIGLTPEDIPIDTMIYKTLLGLDMKALYEKYDLIIMDEYHRTGAIQTYQKIKELKRLLDNNNDGKRFLGLTATPKRYLDRERNMTEEIFDGREASSISLAEAMLEGLLPVPLYINSKLSCIEKYYKIQNKVSRFAPGEKKDLLDKELKEIKKEINYGTDGYKELIKQYIKDPNAKIIIFSNTIEKAEEYYEQVDEWFKHIGPIKKYKVHSHQKYDRNKNEKRAINQDDDLKYNKYNLERFNNDKDGISVMVCVDVLNEGVHVEGVDTLIFLRKTTSPIIYFQQTGRGLAFSTRNKQIKIFDMVNNFDNHSAIYEVYREVQEESKRKMKENPEKREQYQAVLDKFKILDETKQILDRLDEIEKQCTQEEIINSKIEYAIPILQQYDKKLLYELTLKQKEEQKEAIRIIEKYYKYVTNEQLNKLQQLNILLPTELLKTPEERKEELLGFDTIHEYEKNLNDIFVRKTIDFIEKENRIPEENSENDEERKLAKLYYNNIANLKDDIRKELVKKINSKKIKLRSWEKVLLNQKVKISDLDNMIGLAKEYITRTQKLPNYLYEAITQTILKTNTSKNDVLFKLIEESYEIEAKEREEINKQRREKIDEVLNYLEENLEEFQDFEDEHLKYLLVKLQKGDINYIRKRFEGFKKNYFKNLLEDGVKENKEFFKMLKLMDNEHILQYYQNLKLDNEKSKKIIGILKFLKEKNRLPNMDSTDEEEKLAKSLLESIKNDEIKIELEQIIISESKLYNPINLIENILMENLQRNQIQQMVLKNIEFSKKYGRRPLKNSIDKDERQLAENYETKCLVYLTQEEEGILNKILNTRQNRRKACVDYIRNINSQKKGEKDELE